MDIQTTILLWVITSTHQEVQDMDFILTAIIQIAQ